VNEQAPKETPEQELERLQAERAERKKALKARLTARAIEKEKLRLKYESELGTEGSQFEIIDTGHHDDPFVVVKLPALVQWTKWEQSKQTPTDRYDFVVPSVVAPSIEAYNALRQKRYGVEMQASNALGRLLGLMEVDDLGK
jgi:hypothetical protein